MTVSPAVLNHRAHYGIQATAGDAPREPSGTPNALGAPVAGVAGGRLVIHRHPQLAAHAGTPPDVILRWGRMPTTTSVDVVVHFHGYSGRGRLMNLERDKDPLSGLNLSDPLHPLRYGRTRP